MKDQDVNFNSCPMLGSKRFYLPIPSPAPISLHSFYGRLVKLGQDIKWIYWGLTAASYISTLTPSFSNARAHVKPTMPAPIMATSRGWLDMLCVINRATERGLGCCLTLWYSSFVFIHALPEYGLYLLKGSFLYLKAHFHVYKLA